MGDDLTAVNAARVSFNKESRWEYNYELDDARLNSADEKLIKYLARNRHDSCFEHQTITLRLKVPIFIARQIHRHRTFSYNEVSRRYVKENLEFYWPEGFKWRLQADNVKQGSSEEVTDFTEDFAFEVMTTHKHIVDLYNEMVENKVAPEMARMILPQNLYTEFYMTGNLRNWIHFLRLRLHPHAQKEVRDIATQCADIISDLYPVSYEALMTC